MMKKSPGKRVASDRVDPDEILPEYDFKRSEPNKFASRYTAGSAVIVLEPDVAAAFPNSREANEALRAQRESFRNIVSAGQPHAVLSNVAMLRRLGRR
jgi:hypothetical protein